MQTTITLVNTQIERLVMEARAYNRHVIALKLKGDSSMLAAWRRDRAIIEARQLKRGETRDRQVRLALNRIADLVCEIDEEKNALPADHRNSLSNMIDATHGYVRAIADMHGVIVYADQREPKGLACTK